MNYSGAWPPPFRIFFFFWKMSLHLSLFFTSVYPFVSFPLARRTRRLSRSSFPPSFLSGEDRWTSLSPANFYFPASGVLKITLRPCLQPPRPRRVVVVMSCTWWGCIVTDEGLNSPTGLYSSKKAQKGKKCWYEWEKCERHMRRETKIAQASRKDPWVFPFVSSTPTAFFFPPWSPNRSTWCIALLAHSPTSCSNSFFPPNSLATSCCHLSVWYQSPHGTSCNYFSFSQLNSLLPTSANDSANGFLSLINYRVARRIYCDLDLFCPPRFVHSRSSLFRATLRRVVSHCYS